MSEKVQGIGEQHYTGDSVTFKLTVFMLQTKLPEFLFGGANTVPAPVQRFSHSSKIKSEDTHGPQLSDSSAALSPP